MKRYKKHVFVCTNQKEEGKKCCGEVHGMQLVASLREKLLEHGTNPKSEIRVQRAGCLGVCKNGPAIAVYPEGTIYGNVSMNDVTEMVEAHLLRDEEITRLKLTHE